MCIIDSARIEQIEKILKNAEVVLDEEIDLDKISIGLSLIHI